MKVESKKLNSLIPYGFNNRIHSDTQIERIARSIKEFGFNQPIVVDEDNIILVGHGRLEAAKKLGLETAPTVKISGLSEENKKAYRILDNKLQNDSEWEFDNLSTELDFLTEQGFPVEEWGLDDLKSLFPEEEPEVYEDEGGGELPEETYLKLGDLIELGKHRVLCGDSTSADAFQAAFNDCDLFVTDPPYGLGKKMSGGTWATKNSQYKEMHDWDSSADQRFVDIILETKKPCIIWGANYFTLPPSRCWLAWVKPEFPTMSDVELAYVNQDKNAKKWESPRTHSTDGDKIHPTQKPIKLIAWCINSLGVEGIISDPFLGSGTTLIAADQLNRICYGMEISPKYCQVILERYKKHCEKVGKPFECKINGEPFSPVDI